MCLGIEHNVNERKKVVRRKEEVKVLERFGLPFQLSKTPPSLRHTSTYQPEAFHVASLGRWDRVHVVNRH